VGEKLFGLPSRKRLTLSIFVETLSVGGEQFAIGKKACEKTRIMHRRKEVIRMLQNDDALQILLQRVKGARARLTGVIDGGHPVVLACAKLIPGGFRPSGVFI
jgi:hypothetical protein